MQGFRKKLLAALVILVVFVVLLLSSAPASLVNSALATWFPQLVLANSSGSLWKGTASQAWFRHAGKTLPLGKLEWQLSPVSLLLLNPQLEIQADAPGQSLDARVSSSLFGTVTVSELQSRFPLTVFKPWYPVLMEGTLAVELEGLVYKQNWVQELEGSADLNGAKWRMGRNLVPLGDYRAQLGMAGEDVLLNIVDRDADLGVDGTLQLAQNGDYQADLSFEERAASVAQIFQFLSFIAKPGEEGGLVLKTSGNLNGRVNP